MTNPPSALNPIRSKRVPRFAEEYAKDRNGAQAAMRAGFTQNPASAAVTASVLLADPNVQALVAEQIARVSEEAKVTAADILREWFAVATADPSKLTRVRHLNCRHCWGVGGAYRWRDAEEWTAACVEALEAKPKPQTPPGCEGGFGFRRTDEPNPACPRCEGDGIEDVQIADIESLTGPERKLFGGVKMTRNGPEVIIRDQDKARDNIARHIGMLIERKQLQGPNGEPLNLGPATIIVTGPDE
jgi:phage terminase small subunit